MLMQMCWKRVAYKWTIFMLFIRSLVLKARTHPRAYIFVITLSVSRGTYLSLQCYEEHLTAVSKRFWGQFEVPVKKKTHQRIGKIHKRKVLQSAIVGLLVTILTGVICFKIYPRCHVLTISISSVQEYSHFNNPINGY